MLNDIRQQLLNQHERAGGMRPRPSTLPQYAALEKEELLDMLKAIGEEADIDADEATLCHQLAEVQHTRQLLLANDHADILGQSYIMEVAQVVYDTALFYTDVYNHAWLAGQYR